MHSGEGPHVVDDLPFGHLEQQLPDGHGLGFRGLQHRVDRVGQRVHRTGKEVERQERLQAEAVCQADGLDAGIPIEDVQRIALQSRAPSRPVSNT